MQVPTINHGAGPPKPSRRDTTRASPGGRGAVRRTPGPAAALGPARGPGWQVILAMVTCFLASATACDEGSSATPCQNTLVAVPAMPLRPHSVMSRLPAGWEEKRTRSLRAGSPDQLHVPESKQNDVSHFSALLALALGGRASLDSEPGAAKGQQGMDSSALGLNASLALEAHAKITGFSKLSPKGPLTSYKGDLPLSSLYAAKVATEAMDSNLTAVRPAVRSGVIVDGTDASILRSAPKASAQPPPASHGAAALAHLSPKSSMQQAGASASLPSEAWDGYKMTLSAMPVAPDTSRDQEAAKMSPTNVLFQLLPSAPRTHWTSREPSSLTSLITGSTLPASPAAAPTQSTLTLGIHLPESISPLEGTRSGPAELFTQKQPRSSPKASGEAVHMDPVRLGTIPETWPVSLMPAPRLQGTGSGRSPPVTLSTWGDSSSGTLGADKFSWRTSASMPRSASVLRRPSAKPTASTSASAPWRVGDWSHFTELPSPGPMTVLDTLAGAREGAATREMLTTAVLTVSPPVRELPSQLLPVSVSPTAQQPAPSSAPAPPLKVALDGMVQASSDGPSRLPGLGHLLALTPGLPGLSDSPAELGASTSPLLGTTTPESSSELTVVPGVPHSLVTMLSGAAGSNISHWTGAVSAGPLLGTARSSFSEATHPHAHLHVDAATASTSLGGTTLGQHMTEMGFPGPTCPSQGSAALGTAIKKDSPSLAVTQADDSLIAPSPKPDVPLTGLSPEPVASTSQVLTHPTVLASVKPTAADSPLDMLPTSAVPRTQSSTADCCPETSPSVSGARTAANLTRATLQRELAETAKLLTKEQTEGLPDSSELQLNMSSDAPTPVLLSSSSSAKPWAQPARKPYSLRRPAARGEPSTLVDSVLSHSTTSLPLGTALRPRSKVLTSPQNKTFPVLPSKSNDTSGMMETHSTPLYLNRTADTWLAGSAPTAMAHTPVPIPTISARTVPSAWRPISATLGEHKAREESMKAGNVSGVTSTSTVVAKATPVKTRTATSLPPERRTAQLTSTRLPQTSTPKASIFQPLTGARRGGVTSLHLAARTPPTAKTPALPTSARTPATPGQQLPALTKPNGLMWNRTTAPVLLRYPTAVLSTHSLRTSQHTPTAKADLHVLSRTAAPQDIATAAATTQWVATIKMGSTSKHVLPKSKASTRSFSPRPKSGSVTRPTSPLHILPLRFRLLGAAYIKLLKNKSSDIYEKLEKEVTLTLNKMLSSYENFLQVNILQFLNGSILVESEAVFQGDGPAPTNSDLIRTVVTGVVKRMDTFYDWRVDIPSICSSGFSLENLEPEKLLVSFTALRLGSTVVFGSVRSQGPLDTLNDVVVQSLSTLYKVKRFSIVRLRDVKGDLEFSGEAYLDTPAHADISQVLQALRALAHYSVDLTTLSVAGTRLSLQVFPISFLINNWVINEKLLDHSSVEHQNITMALADVLTHTLKKYQSFLQVVIRNLLSGSLICHGDVMFQLPAPSSADVLQTLLLSVGPGEMLAGSGFQVDPYSFTVAGNRLEPPFIYSSFPGYGVAIVVLCGLIVTAIPVVTLLYLNSRLFGWHHKAIIHSGRDPEARTQTFELDNQGFRSAIEEDEGKHSYTPKASSGE